MNNYLTPNLLLACKILRLLAQQPAGFSATQIEKKLSASRTTVFRTMKTLCHTGMAHKKGKQFIAGPALIEIGVKMFGANDLRNASVPLLQELAQATGETAHFAIPTGLHSLILEVCDSPHPVRVASRPGTVTALHNSSTGKVFMAWLYADQLDEIAAEARNQKHTKNTLTSVRTLRDEVKKILEQGYAVDNKEYHNDVRCLAAPVFDRNGKVIGAIGVTGTIMSFPIRRIAQIARYVLDYAEKLSKITGYDPVNSKL